MLYQGAAPLPRARIQLLRGTFVSSPSWTIGFMHSLTAFWFSIKSPVTILSFLAHWASYHLVLRLNFTGSRDFLRFDVFLHLFLTCLEQGVEAAAPRYSPTKTHRLTCILRVLLVKKSWVSCVTRAGVVAWQAAHTAAHTIALTPVTCLMAEQSVTQCGALPGQCPGGAVLTLAAQVSPGPAGLTVIGITTK